MEGSYLLGGDGLLASLVKLFNGFLVVTEIFLAADEDDGEATAEMNDFGDPLVSTCQRFSYLESRAARRERRHTFSWTLSRESGESTAKQIRMTWESG
jgi:hypothetical protein